MTPKFLPISEGWRRVVLAISFLWVVVSNALYFSDVGSTLHSKWDDSEPLPTWMVLWYRITLGLAPHLYDFAVFSYGNRWTETSRSTTTFEYSAIGHAAFVAIPLVLIFALSALTAWIAIGFAKSTKSIDNAES